MDVKFRDERGAVIVIFVNKIEQMGKSRKMKKIYLSH